jgi:branched-subunit amino acid aminotransferase/4-amino-4-deoxychorismate lyase
VTEPIVYFRGRLVPASEAKLSIYDLGIVLGATVTDLLRTFRHQPYRLEDHVRRFYESCRYARLTPAIGPEETAAVTRQIIEHNTRDMASNADLAVVWFITPGESPIYAGSAAGSVRLEPTYVIHSFPLPFHVWSRLFTEGAHLVIPSTRHVPPQCVDPKVKNRSRMHWWLADQEAHLTDPRAIPLLLDLEGNLTETSGANVLFVKNGAVISPTPRNILLGVSRDTIRRICDGLGIPFVERDLQVHDAINADEGFLATTPYCMAPVTRVNGIEIGDGRPGPVFERILAQWSEEAGVDIRAQVLG